ncbi:MAG TPA: hypothetical protein VJO15_09595 [Dehalococcoidia bacterium]|nr:hypothetical protein [Dehalococcoidia bacterium]
MVRKDVMAQGRFAKYHKSHEPAMQCMLIDARIAALEMALALAEVQLARPEMEKERAHLVEQRTRIKAALARARRKMGSST